PRDLLVPLGLVASLIDYRGRIRRLPATPARSGRGAAATRRRSIDLCGDRPGMEQGAEDEGGEEPGFHEGENTGRSRDHSSIASASRVASRSSRTTRTISRPRSILTLLIISGTRMGSGIVSVASLASKLIRRPR